MKLYNYWRVCFWPQVCVCLGFILDRWAGRAQESGWVSALYFCRSLGHRAKEAAVV